MIATTGPSIQVGYQGQWTDPVTKQVNMGSRFYQPSTGGFINKDTAPQTGGPAVTDNLYAYADDNPMSVTDPTGHAPSAKGGSGGPTAGAVAAATARAAEAHGKAAAAEAAALGAKSTAIAASVAAHGAAVLARLLNTAASRLAEAASKASQAAAEAFKQAQAELRVAEAWQDRADAAWHAAWNDLAKTKTWEVWNDPKYVYEAGVETKDALYDEIRAGAAFAETALLFAKAVALQTAADIAHGVADVAALAAKGADRAAELAAKLSDVASRAAGVMAAYAAQEEAIAAHDDAIAGQLAKEYAAELARKAAKIADAAKRVIKKVAKKIGKAAVKVAKVAYKASGAQDVVSCVTNPTLGECVKAAVNVALVVGTGGEGAVAEVGVDVAEGAAEHLGEEGVADAVGDAAESCVTGGGASFTADTKVVLASGKAVPISSLKVGDKVLATDTKTGKTQPEAVTAVLVHHDTDLYDLKVKANGLTAVIDTTSSHLFWVPGTGGHSGKWTKAGALKYGTHLRTPSGGTATVAGGYTPRNTAGWMWDLTVPGNNDHDFYIVTTPISGMSEPQPYHRIVGTTAVLVHNCGDLPEGYTSSPALKGDPYHPDTVADRSAENQDLYSPTDSDRAADLGYDRRIPTQKAPFNSHGQEVFSNGKNYITPDWDGHNVTGGWKLFSRRGVRIGTYDSDLNYVKE